MQANFSYSLILEIFNKIYIKLLIAKIVHKLDYIYGYPLPCMWLHFCKAFLDVNQKSKDFKLIVELIHPNSPASLCISPTAINMLRIVCTKAWRLFSGGQGWCSYFFKKPHNLKMFYRIKLYNSYPTDLFLPLKLKK